MTQLGTRLWIAFGVTAISLTLFVVSYAVADSFVDKFGLHAPSPFILIAAAIGGPILGVMAMRKSIRTVGASPALIAFGSFVGAVGGFYCARYGRGILGLFSIPAILIAPFLGAFVATFIRKQRTVAVP